MTIDPVRTPASSSHLTAWLDRFLDGVVTAFAVWTLCYHLALITGWTRDTTAVVWAAASAALVVGTLFIARRRNAQASDPEDGDDEVGRRPDGRRIPTALVLAAGLALSASAGIWIVRPPWWWVWWSLSVAVTAAGVVSTMRTGEPERIVASPGPRGGPRGTLGVIGVVALAVVFAVLSLLTQRPDADDVFLLNQATYVEEHDGPFPTRDVLFADQAFESTRPEASRTAIEPLVGVVGAASGLASPTIAYLLLAPAVAALGILALWRLLRSLGAAWPAVATLTAAVYLFLDGSEHASFGNLSFGRSWQGKVVFLTVVVPILWHHALTWARSRRVRSLLVMVACGIAGVGLTSTAALVVPATVVVAMGAGRARSAAAYGGAAIAVAYPIGVAFVAALDQAGYGVAVAEWAAGTLAIAPPVAGAPGTLQPEALWYTVFGDGYGAFLGIAGALLGWQGVRRRTGRLALAGATLLVLVVFLAPGMLDVLDALTGARSILWRALWVIPVPAAVALLLLAPRARAAGSTRQRRWAAAMVPVAALIALALAETPVISADNDARFGRVSWDVDVGARAAAETLIRLSEPGDVIAAPTRDAGMLAIMTSTMHAVSPRDSTTRRLQPRADARVAQRRLVTSALTAGVVESKAPHFVLALDALSVDTACLRPTVDASTARAALVEAGFEIVARDDQCIYWRRTGAKS